MIRIPRTAARALALAVPLAAAGCDRLDRFVSGTSEDRLVQAAVAQWARRGAPFLDGVTGRDTIASVSATGARSWEVAIIPAGGGPPETWALEVVRAETWPVFTGERFAGFLEERWARLGAGPALPPATLAALREGAIAGVGSLEVRYGLAHGASRATISRVAYLIPGPGGQRAAWEIQRASGTPELLRDALRAIAGEMVQTDERVRACLGGAGGAGSGSAAARACVQRAWAEEFEGGG